MGMEHYSTSKNVAKHVFAGVKKAFAVGICKSTYGKVKEIINPVVGGAQISGIGLESRIDSKFMAWSKMVPILFDIAVA
jgi:ACT domain-containing protein